MQILLMIVFRIIERLCRGDLGGDSARVVGLLHCRLETREAGFRGFALFRRQRINSGTILRAAVVTLLHALRRVVIFPEDLKQLLIADNLRIVDHAHGLSMARLAAANFTIGGVWRVAAGVTCGGAINAGQLPEQAFDAPETAHGEQSDFHSGGDVGHRMAIDGVERSHRHRRIASRQRVRLGDKMRFIK